MKELNEKLRRFVDDEIRMLGGVVQKTFPNTGLGDQNFYAEGFSYLQVALIKLKELGVDGLLELEALGLTIGAFLSLLYALIIEGRVVKDGTARDIQHVAPDVSC
jgi:hypothetical protein